MAKRKIKPENLPEKCKNIDDAIDSATTPDDFNKLIESWGYMPIISRADGWQRNTFMFRTNEIYDTKLYTCVGFNLSSYNYNTDTRMYNITLGTIINGKRYYKDICSIITGSGVITKIQTHYKDLNSDWYTDDLMHWNILWINYSDIMNNLKTDNPYLYKYCISKEKYAAIALSFPALEILDKAGYKIADEKFLSVNTTSEMTMLQRTFKNGTSPKDIIQIPKRYFKEMKDVCEPNVWDNVRKLVKTTDISTDAVKLMLRDNVFIHNITAVYAILKAKWNNKPVFTTEKLIAYFQRIDMYEAIDIHEGIPLLKDYLHMCQILHMKPKIDGDSLKREHDVAARLCRQKRDEELAKKMQSKCDELQKYNYSEDVFIIRGIKSYDDLIDEAKQQHNCVASYAQYIVSGDSCIYVMREKKYPDNSLVTLELSPDGKTIRQKFLAYNQPIRNKAQTEFIERWHKYVLNCIKNKDTIAMKQIENKI